MGRQKIKGSMRTPSGRYIVGKPVLGRKFCRDCGRWRLLMDFPAHSRSSKGTVVYFEPTCRTCHYRRYKNHLATKKGRERKRQRDREWFAAKRREQGIPQRNFKKSRVPPEKDHMQVPNAPLREAFLDSGLTVQEVARRCDWMRDGLPDGLLVKRRLGLVATEGKPYERLSYDNAVTLCRAIGVDPVSVGV